MSCCLNIVILRFDYSYFKDNTEKSVSEAFQTI